MDTVDSRLGIVFLCKHRLRPVNVIFIMSDILRIDMIVADISDKIVI